MLKTSLRYVVGLLFSLGLFTYFVGIDALSPNSYVWMRGDGVINLYGWLFYQNSPWQWPISKIDFLAYPVGVLNVQLDVIPGVAALMKLLVHQPFQYFGVWLFSCFILMQFFGTKILQALGYSNWESVFFSSFFVLATPFLGRFDHAALSAQWVFVALAFISMSSIKEVWKIIWMGCLLSFFASVHPYLFVMVGGIFVLWCLFATNVHLGLRLSLCAFFCAVAASILYSLGYFSLKSATGYGFGSYNMDLLGWINSLGRSAFIPALRAHAGAYEALCYLGIGPIVSLVIGYFWGKKHKVSFVGVVGVGLLCPVLAALVYSYLDRIRFGGNVIADLGVLLGPLEFITSGLRVSGRFMWPFFYLFIVWYFFKMRYWFEGRLLRNLILATVLIVQILEFAPLRRSSGAISQEQLARISSFLTGAHLMAFEPPYVGFFEDGTSCFSPESYSEEENGWILVAAAHRGLRVAGGYFARAQSEHKSLCSQMPEGADVIVYSKTGAPSLSGQNCLELEHVFICRRVN